MSNPTRIVTNAALVRLKTQAFEANRQAKRSAGQIRDAAYRRKVKAINTLLKAGLAFVNAKDTDWSRHDGDAMISISFLGGGQLHATLSGLDLAAFRIARAQLNEEIIFDFSEAA